MDERHRELLIRNRKALMKDLDAWSVSIYLYQEQILSEIDFQLIKAERIRLFQAEKVLDIIPQRGPDAFNAFCEALKETDGQKHLLALLVTPGLAPQGEVHNQ
ncbi:caspase-2-like [Acropora millepora]|uniref:caspase-2-like n=1 Tax=Acropora millepora TaxID=45264 RepID=UPI001CF554C5|nr:caspase-2-like [Acropora millepora]XP_044167660.1 caspase-2-like [Acropora millepora]